MAIEDRINAGRQGLADYYKEALTPLPQKPPGAEGAGIRRVADVGIDVAKVIPGVIESAAGLVNLPFAPLNVAPLKGVEQTARSVSDWMSQGYSSARQAEEAAVSQAIKAKQDAGLWEQLKAGASAAVENPAVGIGMLPRIATEMAIGAKGAGAIAPKLSGAGRAALGEAGVTAGSSSAQIGEATDEEYRRLMALPAAAATGLIARGAGSLVNRMAEIPGVAGAPGRFLQRGTDPETYLAQRFAGETPQGPVQGNLISRMAAGGIREGLLEELPQSFQERVMQNVALGQPWMQGAGVEAGLGAVLGGAMGAGFNIRRQTLPAPTTTETAPAVPQVGTNVPELGVTAEAGQPTSQIAALPDRKEIGLSYLKQDIYDQALTARSKAEFDALDIKGFKDKSKEKLRTTPWYESLPDTTPIAPVPEKKGNFFGIKNDLWTDITAKASKEEVDQVIDNTKGIGAKIRNDFRASEWYQSLPGKGVAPSATAEQPAAKTTAAAQERPDFAVDDDSADVIKAFNEAFSKATSEGAATTEAMSVEGAPATQAAPKKATKAQQALPTVPTDALDSAVKASTTPEQAAEPVAPRPVVAGLVSAIAGYLPGLSRAKGVELMIPWKRENRRTNFLAGLGADPENPEAGDARDLLANIHRTTRELEGLAAAAGSTTTGYVQTRAGFKKVEPSEKGGLGAEELAKSDPEAATNAIVQTAEQYRAVAARLANDYARLENIVGKQTLRTALQVGKYIQFNVSTPATSKTRLQTETPEAVRFSQYYRQYATGELGTAAIPSNLLRPESALDKRVNDKLRAEGKYIPSRLEEIASGQAMRARDKAKEVTRSQSDNILRHLSNTAPNPIVRKIAGQVRAVLEKQGVLDKIDIVFVNSRTADNGSTNAFFTFNPDPKKFGLITFYRSGENYATILHEFIHAATAAALRNKEFRNTPAFKNLEKIAKQIASVAATLNLDDVTRDYGGDAATAIRVIQSKVASKSAAEQLKAVDELLAYGFTSNGLQSFMKATQAPKGLAQIKNLWLAFVQTIKSYLGINAVPNSTFERFVEAGGGLLQQIYETENALKRPRGGLGQLEAVVSANPNEAFDPKAAAFDQAEMQAAQAAYADGTALSEKALSKFQKERAEARETLMKARAQAPEVRAAKERAEAAAETTAVVPRQADKDNIVDSVGRSILNSIAPLVFNDPDWQRGAENWWTNTGKQASDWSMSGNKPLQVAARKVFGQIVDKYGQPGQFRGAFDRFMGALQRINTEAFSFNELLGTEDSVQNAAVEYLINRDAEALAKAVPDPAQAAYVTQLIDAMEQVYREAEAQELIDPKFFGRPLVDFVRFTDKKKVQAFKDQAFGPVAPTVNNKLFVFEKDVPGVNVLDRKGQPVVKGEAGTKYFRLQRKDTGEPVFVREGVKNADITKLNLTGIPNDTFAYTLRTVDQSGQVTFARMKTPQERQAAGEIVEPVASMVSSFIEISRKVQAAKFTAELKNINSALADDAKWITNTAPVGVPAERVIDLKNKGDLADLSNKELVKRVRIPGMWVKIPDDAKGQWGDLAGSYVAGPVYAAFQDFYNTEPVIQSGIFRAFMAMWKKFKTVYSPVTHVNNVGGNFTLAYYHDIPMRNIKTGFKLVFGKELTVAEQQLKKEFEASGATLGNFQADFDKSVADEWLNDGNNEGDVRSLVNGLLGMQKVFIAMSKADKNLSDIYSNQDNVFRVAAYMTELEKNLELNKTAAVKKTVKQLKEEAASFARKSFVDYGITAPAIQFARQTYAPFLAWPYRMVPLMAKTMVTKPWKAANTMAVIYGLNSLAYAMGGGDEEEERKLLPEYMQTNVWGIPGLPAYIRLPFGEEGKGQYFGIGRMLPLGDMGEINHAGLPSMIAPSGPAIILLQAAMNTDGFTGQDIRKETDTGAQAAGNTLAFLAKQLGPGIGYTGYKWFDNVVNDRRGPLGADANNWVETARLLGANVREVDFQEAAYSQSVRAAQLKRAYGAARNAAVREHLRYGNPDMDALYQDVLDINTRGGEAIQDIYGIKGEGYKDGGIVDGIAPYGGRYAESTGAPFKAKGKGYFGAVPHSGGGVATELSASNENGAFPLIVPTLTKEELNHLVSGKEPTQSIYNKAQAYAEARRAEGRDPFANPFELRYPIPK